MPDYSYTEEELQRYFENPTARRTQQHEGAPQSGDPSSGNGQPPKSGLLAGLHAYLHRRFHDPQKEQAALALVVIAAAVLLFTLTLGLYTIMLGDDLPSLEQLENPTLQLATVAYTADGRELARYAFQNRSWVVYDDISEHVVNALVATEDHRFAAHWGVDVFRTFSAVGQTILDKLGFPGFQVQGGSTLTQQLARNLFNEQIGFQQTVTRKLKEMVTAVQLERRYTKQEIIEMYLNTVPFLYNAFGIEAAARTFFGKPAEALNVEEAAVLVGMLKNPPYYNPIRNPERSQERRNVVLRQMVRNDYIPESLYTELRTKPVVTDFNPSEITASLAPYFAEYVRNWMRDWAKANGHDLYAGGLVVYTTLDSRLQEFAQAAVDEQMEGLQAVVDYEWSRRTGFSLGRTFAPYLAKRGEVDPFAYLWESKRDLVDGYIRETDRFKNLREGGVEASTALTQLRGNEAFMDSLKAIRTRLEAGLVSLDPRTGYVKAWVGGRDLKQDWYDHVATAKRQPGSTFKPFVYTAAIDNGYPPSYSLPDQAIAHRLPNGQIWRPGNFGGSSGRMMTLRSALANSVNTVTAQLMMQIGPSTVAFYARRMGVRSDLNEVPALALGTSDVTLLEMTAAYGTLANGGLYYTPTAVIRIEDRFGNVLYEAEPSPEEAISEETAYTVVDMMRGVIDGGTAVRLKRQYDLDGYDLAGKTGTTQNAADGWFMLMHPDLVTGGWVGFNDRRIAFRSNFWGQGAHNAMYVVGDFFGDAAHSSETQIDKAARFPEASAYLLPDEVSMPSSQEEQGEEAVDETPERERVGW